MALDGVDDSDYDNDSAEEAGDKDMDDCFMEYSDALNQELSKTSIKETFSRAPHNTSNEVKKNPNSLLINRCFTG
jgi:hypothetical protein